MALFSRITNLGRGLWITNTRPSGGNAAEDAAFEEELAQTRPQPRAARAGPARPTATPEPEVVPEPARPVELDADGNVKRSL